MLTNENENNDYKNMNENWTKKEYTNLPDINLHSPYHTRGLSENQKILNKKIQEILKEKFENRPINQQAVINKYLNRKCNIFNSVILNNVFRLSLLNFSNFY